MKSSAQITTKVLSATLLISLISASQSEAVCGGSRNSPIADIAAACAAATNGGKAEIASGTVFKVTKLDNPEAAAVGIVATYSEGGKKPFRTKGTGVAISRCHILSAVHLLPHNVDTTKVESANKALVEEYSGKGPSFNPFLAETRDINERMDIKVAIASTSDPRGFEVLRAEIVGLKKPESSGSEKPRLAPEDDLMLLRVKSMAGIVPMELDQEPSTNGFTFDIEAFSFNNIKDGLNVKKLICDGAFGGASSVLGRPTKVKHTCSSDHGDSGSMLTRLTEASEGGKQRRVLTGILVSGPDSASVQKNVKVSEYMGVYVNSIDKKGLIEKWMLDNPCED